MEIGDKIKFFRLQREYSINYVAEKLKISLNEYENIESGITDITFKQLEAIALILTLKVVDIIQHDDASAIGIKNYFFNQSGNTNTNVKNQGVDQDLIVKVFDDLYQDQLKRIPVLLELLRKHNIDFSF